MIPPLFIIKRGSLEEVVRPGIFPHERVEVRTARIDLRLAFGRPAWPGGGVGGLFVRIFPAAVVRKIFQEIGEDLLVEGAEEAVRKLRGFAVADVIGPFLGELVGQAGDLAPREGRAATFGGRHAHRRPHDPIGASRAGKSETDAERLLAEPADRGAGRERIRPEQEDRLAFDVAYQQVALHVG